MVLYIKKNLDDKVKISNNDNNTDYLSNKLLAGENISLDLINSQGDEKLKISSIHSTNIINTFNCSSNENVLDVVYIKDDMSVARANASTINTSNVIGVIIDKPSDTTCSVVVHGIIDIFSNLEVSKRYFLDINDGQITTIPTTSPGTILLELGVALTDTMLLFDKKPLIKRT